MGSLTRTEIIDTLPDREREAYFKHMKTDGTPLAAEVALRIFTKMYLMGKSLDEIQRTNHKWTLGMLVQAKIEGGWDERRIEYQNAVLDKVREAVIQTHAEAVHFVTDQIRTTHSTHRDRMMKYLETGDETVLGDMAIKNMKQYKEAVDMLFQLTGQDNPTKKVQSEVKHTVKVEEIKKEPEKPKELPSAGTLLKLLDGGT